MNNSLLILSAKDIEQILDSKEEIVIDIVKNTYIKHKNGLSSLPFSTFLRFPNHKENRIIGLPAYLGGDEEAAGIKWISSFPKNIYEGIERASAINILNNMKNGQAETILEGSRISMERTAASAALAAKYLHGNSEETKLGLIGCGVINREIVKFILSIFSKIDEIYVYDIDDSRAEDFGKSMEIQNIRVNVEKSVEDVFRSCELISVATTAGEPFIFESQYINEKRTILDISLRDFAPEIIENAYNIVDDVDHVCRERTSIHLTEQKLNHREFISGTIADVITNTISPRVEGKPVIFSPFGLGILDLALGKYVEECAIKQKQGTVIEEFR